MALEAGFKLGPYKIIEPAGAGGMGEVYKAVDTRLDRIVAIKVLPSNMALNDDIRARFEREAKSISSLNHPNICILHDIGKENSIDYLVMEFLEGETLAERLKKGPLNIENVYTIAIEICDALNKAHSQGLVHRDLKPGNVMLTKSGAKLMDFGLAKISINSGVQKGLTEITQTTPLTGVGTIIGTMQYMAPEQLEGEEADARSDIFAFGTMLYEMVTGLKAFDGKSQATLIAGIIGQEPQSITELKPMVQPGLDRIVKKCMSKNADKRWQSANDLADELRWISISGSQAGIPAPLAAKRKFKFNLARIVGAVAIFLLFGMSYLYYAEISKPIPVIKSSILPDVGTKLNDEAAGTVVLSPQGDKIVFIAKDTTENEPKLWVRSLNTITSIPLKGTENATFPFWSHDGKYLAFYANGKMSKILATGGPVLTICEAENGRPGSWNKNDIIIFTPYYTGPMFKVAAAGGKKEQLTALDTTNTDHTHRYPFFLPDNDHYLFYVRTESGGGSEKDMIAVSSLSDTSITRLFHAKSNVAFANGYILFMRESILMAQQFDKKKLVLIGNALPIAENVSFDDNYSRGVFSVSNTNQLIYRSGEVENGSSLRLYSDDFKKVDTVGDVEEHDSFGLSNDNRHVALSIDDPQSTKSNIWIYDLQRNIKRRFTFDDGYDYMPIWSPNDSQIVYATENNGVRYLMLKNRYGTEPAKALVKHDKYIVPWSWSSDGKYITYSATQQNAGMDLFIYSFEGNKVDSLYLATEFTEGGGQISPDGKWLAYFSNESGKFELYVSTFPKFSAKWQVSTNTGGFSKWSRDGKRIYFVDQDNNINVVEVNGAGNNFEVGKIKQLKKISESKWPGFAVFNDEKTILTVENEIDETIDEFIHVMNWTNEFKK